MTDIAIAAVSGAGVTIAVAIALLVLGLRGSDAERRCADARVDATNRKAQAAIDSTTIAELRAALDQQTKRADALATVANDPVATDVVGAHARVLQRWKAEDVPAGSDADRHAGPVLDGAAAGTSDKPKPNG